MRDIDLYEAVAWIDQDDRLRAVAPWTAAARVDRIRQVQPSGAVDTVRMHGYATDPVSAQLVESETLLAVQVAACPGGSACTGELAGFINLDRRFTRAIGSGQRDLCLTVSTGGRTLFTREEPGCRADSRRGFAYLGVGRLAWTFTVAPTPVLLSATGTYTSRAPAILPHADALVRQVVFNLVQNAVEASPPNGRVDVTAWTENGSFHLSVQDRGPGVPLAMRERIFDDFFSTKTGLTTGGMGLGLSIVRRSLRALRGEIEIHDTPGGGADFRVRRP